MSTEKTEQRRQKFIQLLRELFQLDQPDLDFGFYRIMHAKADQVTQFLEDDLLKIIHEAFGEVDDMRVKQLRETLEAARARAKQDQVPVEAIEKYKPVREAREAYNAAQDSGSNEGDIYDHLYRFFERYYDNGDFMSRRYFARETDGKAAPYAIPYDGREVYLHWANRDQYYIKTSEYLSNFTFDPTKAKEFQAHHGALFDQTPLKVHCRIVAASEGEHNNVKASEQTERYFIIHEPEPVRIETGDTGEPELVIQFEYRPDPEKTGQEGTWRKQRLTEAAEKVKALLPKLEGAIDYATALMTPAPTEAEKDRTLLEKYLAQYTGRNTMDYFIHKDLGGFLRRELDFYIKNEVMRLDDIESADAPQVETYLAKVKVLRRIAQHLIDFLAQLEDFQKKLWLKKKFVVDTQYCITLDRIPEELYPEIAANDAQRVDWVRLFAIDELQNYTQPLTQEFLTDNQSLPLDTAHFEEEFRDRLVSELQELEERVSGYLFSSENFQGIRLANRLFDKAIDTIYIDPPYNTDAGPIAYKNGYRSSSWATFMQDRLEQVRKLMSKKNVICVTIDDYQVHELAFVLDGEFGREAQLGTSVIRNNPSGRSTVRGLSICHEYAFFYNAGGAGDLQRLPRSEKQLNRFSIEDGRYVDWRNFRKDGGAVTHRRERPKQYYPIFVNSESLDIRIPKIEWLSNDREWKLLEQPATHEETIFPIDENGRDRVWSLNHISAEANLSDLEARHTKDGAIQIYRRHIPSDGVLPRSWWDKSEYAAREHGSATLKKFFGENAAFSFAKSPYAVRDCIWVSGANVGSQGIVMDFFAGSATTAHAVIDLNRSDDGSRKFFLVEMEGYFESVTKPRTLKAAYSTEWKNGKPITHDGVSHAIKYLRVESYEDALNNLGFRSGEDLANVGPDFTRDYMLRYWLDFETKGSPSLLNIEWFDDPTAYKLKIKKPGTDEYVEKAVDLVETFNWLIGLHVEHLDRWRGYDAAFKREVDPELPKDTNTRLILDGRLKETDDGAWRFRKVEGYTLRTPGDHNDREKALVVWRKLTGDIEQDNLMLDEWFRTYRLSAQNTEFDVIYVNGSNNLPNLRQAEETWKVRLIEEAFHQAMWDVES